MFVSAFESSCSPCERSVLYRAQPDADGETAKVDPLCGQMTRMSGNRATEAEGPPELRKPRSAGRAA